MPLCDVNKVKNISQMILQNYDFLRKYQVRFSLSYLQNATLQI